MNNVEVDIDKIHDLIFCFANGDFSKRFEVSKNGDHTDTIISGINMLGEELEESTISKEYFRSIYNAITDIVLVTDASGIITSMNRAAVESLKVSNEKLLGLNLINVLNKFFNPKDLITFIKSNSLFQSFETEIDLNGKKRTYLSTLSKIHSKFKSQEGILVIAKDVTTEKNLEGEILNAIIETEERERRRLANDLHDALGQELNSVKMMFESLLLIRKNSEKFREVMELCINVMDDCINNTRLLSYDLMPKTLEDEKLFCAFEELEKSHVGLLNIDVIVPMDEFNISKVRKINIFRVVQEFITNTLKHSEANKLIIESFIEDDKYCFEITDNGIGFDVNKKSNGSGLKNIKTRLKVIDSKFELSSVSNSGTKLKFCLK